MACADAICLICFSTEMQWHGGSLLCAVCGSQSQDFAEESQEFQAGVDDNRFRRRLRAPAAPKAAATASQSADFSSSAVVETYLSCLQAGLQEIMRVLVKNMEMHADASTVARRLWSAHLSCCGILQPDFAMRLGEIAARKAAAKGKGRATVAMDEDAVVVDPHQSLWRLLRDAVWKVLAPDAVLAVVLLAAWLLREAVGPVDIVRWALAGRLPYLELPHVHAAALAAAPSEFPLQLLQPQGLPNAHEIEMAAAAMAAQLGLHLPPLNVPAHLQRAALVLGLPEAAWVAAAEVWSLQREGDGSCRLSRMPSAAPYAHALAPLVVALKLLYGLDGRPPPSLPQGTPAPHDWQAWAAAAYQHVSDPCQYPLSTEQTLALPPAEQQRYVEYLRRHVFGQAPVPPDFQELQASLDAQSRAQQQPQEQQPAGGRRSRLSSSMTMDSAEQHAQPVAADGTHAVNMMAPSAQAHAAAAPAESAPADTREPDGLGSAHDASTGVTYTSSMNVKGELVGHPDYLAVLTVVAAYGWVTPKFLHRLVVALERDMMEMEVALTVQE